MKTTATVTFYGVYFVDAQTGAKTLCEVDGGVCYMAYRELAKAEAIAASCNESAESHGWESRYTVSSILAGVLVWDDLTASKVITGVTTEQLIAAHSDALLMDADLYSLTYTNYLKGRVSHDAYYLQYATPSIIARVKSRIDLDVARQSTDRHFNDIYNLKHWTDILYPLSAETRHAMRLKGDSASMASAVCIAKCVVASLIKGTK